ncbi:hypothetical protein F4801DRAFT_561238 [Xylaria longipes]|nr:hypothetical protein F4801DRAFT_561238 [Xylaria longipes]
MAPATSFPLAKQSAIIAGSEGTLVLTHDAPLRVKWLLDRYDGLQKELTPELLTQDLLFITVAAIQTSAAVGCSIIFDMIDRPESLSRIRSEISDIREACGGKWDRHPLAKLRFLDSFIKESKRVNFLSRQLIIWFYSQQPYTFDDGLHVPAGTQLSCYGTYISNCRRSSRRLDNVLYFDSVVA